MSLIDIPTSPTPNVLIIKPGALGDVVHTLPVLNLLRRRWPEARISWLVGSPFATLLQGHPQLDEVITFDRGRFAEAGATRARRSDCFGSSKALASETSTS